MEVFLPQPKCLRGGDAIVDESGAAGHVNAVARKIGVEVGQDIGNAAAEAFRVGFSRQSELEIELTDRIIMSPFAAKRLQQLLGNLMNEYETRYGKLEVDATIPDGTTKN